MKQIYNTALSTKNFAIYQEFIKYNQDLILLLPNEYQAILTYEQLIFFSGNKNSIFYLPSFNVSSYEKISSSSTILAQRAQTLTQLAINTQPKILITNSTNLLLKLGAASILKNQYFILYPKSKLSIDSLSKLLISLGFTREAVAIDSGEFAIRGEIVDIVTATNSYRINLHLDYVESIRYLNTETQIANDKREKLEIFPIHEIILNHETIDNFRKNYLVNFGVNNTNHPIYNAIIHYRKSPAYENLYSLFYQEHVSLLDFLKKPIIFYDQLAWHNLLQQENDLHSLYNSRILANKSNFYPTLPPEKLYFTTNEIKQLIENSNNFLLEYSQENNLLLPSNIVLENQSKEENQNIQWLLSIIKQYKHLKICICYQSKTNSEYLERLLKDEYPLKYTKELNLAQNHLINLCQVPLEYSFYNNLYLFISEDDIFGAKINKATNTNSQTRLYNILNNLNNLEENEFIVHEEYGIGKFIGLETINVDNIAHDCLKILYADDARLYVPVEQIGLLKKYGNSNIVALDRLGTTAWQKRKAILKNRINEIASNLIKTAATRELIRSGVVDYSAKEFDEFCRSFKYIETDDQIKAIEDIRNDFASGTLMDRLICGDVGFGKTEIAMRAAFMITRNSANPSAQVAVIVPTTILCKQHYTNFVQRFSPFGITVVQLSRLISPANGIKTKKQIASGEANIIIGTHALLSKNIQFYNLQLLIIDEEQHFGVKQKEAIKNLKTLLHVLSLSATPVPRTLQMSVVGLKNLSIVATPPVDRLATRCHVIVSDPVTIREILLKEHQRGGVSFYVCPKISDIEYVEKQLKKIVPELSYRVAHGQMPVNEVEIIMEDFHGGKFDILLATTIIGSGVDIPIANTIIIHKADMFGLSQLYQLKGRVGRSTSRAYAYLTILEENKINPIAQRRLSIIENLDYLGGGFNVASYDLDIRGFGNLIGEEQSGHIKEVGIEMYNEMLSSQIALLKNQQQSDDKNYIPTINLGISVLIPNSYIQDANLKINIYQRISRLRDKEETENFYHEIIDRFGIIPNELQNLLEIVKIKHKCYLLHISSIDASDKAIVISFRKNIDVSSMVIRFISEHQNNTKIRENSKLVHMLSLKRKNIIQEVNHLLDKLSLAQ